MNYADRLLAMSDEQHYFETGFYPGEEAPDELSCQEWLTTLTPSEYISEAGTNPEEGCWDSDQETARLERINLYSSVEEYDRYEGDDS